MRNNLFEFIYGVGTPKTTAASDVLPRLCLMGAPGRPTLNVIESLGASQFGAPEQGWAVSVVEPARAGVMASSARRRVHLGMIAKLIGHSPIVSVGLLPRAAARRSGSLDLPAGYESVDIFILDWLATEALRGRRNYLPV
jgi:hypothetical protein